MSKIEVNTVAPQCGTTLTLGESGDTVTLGSGASQSGFGRTGTVDWDTTAKTASFTAVSGNGYFVDTSSGAITVTLPASPSAGNIVYVKDYDGSFSTNNCTVARNSSNIRGGTDDFVLQKNNSGAVFIYVDATEGWQVFVDGSDSDAQSTFICASGGTVTTCGNFKIHTFTGPGTFTVCSLSCSPSDNNVDYLVVAGGGGSGACKGGGSGAGGYRESSGTTTGCYSVSPLGACVSALPVTVQSYPITVGAGGTGTNTAGVQTSGANSIFNTITSAGGGRGSDGSPGQTPSANGGSGGGGARNLPTAGNGNTPPVSPPQGNDGGGSSGPTTEGAGGGGATAAGQDTPETNGGDGGAGATSSINGTPTARAGGGGGGADSVPNSGAGGTGGGGAGAGGPGNNGSNGTANTGGGGGGGPNFGTCGTGGSGGSGIVIIRYKFQ